MNDYPPDGQRIMIQAFADEHYPEGDGPAERTFILLCRVAGHLLRQYHEQDVPNLDNPASFTPRTLGGVPHGWALLEGLKENMEIDFPDDEFREMLPGRKRG